MGLAVVDAQRGLDLKSLAKLSGFFWVYFMFPVQGDVYLVRFLEIQANDGYVRSGATGSPRPWIISSCLSE